MTEAEWLASDDPVRLMCGLRGHHVKDRKKAMFEIATAESLGLGGLDRAFTEYAEFVVARFDGRRPNFSRDDVDRLTEVTSEASHELRLRARELAQRHGEGDPAAVRAAE